MESNRYIKYAGDDVEYSIYNLEIDVTNTPIRGNKNDEFNADIYIDIRIDSFGNITSQTENISNRFKYSGEQQDRITGQYYLRARYYNPQIGRFTQEDTYRGDGLNLYAYVANNPLAFVDPTGHECQKIKELCQDVIKLVPNNLSNKPAHMSDDKWAAYQGFSEVVDKSSLSSFELKYFNEFKKQSSGFSDATIVKITKAFLIKDVSARKAAIKTISNNGVKLNQVDVNNAFLVYNIACNNLTVAEASTQFHLKYHMEELEKLNMVVAFNAVSATTKANTLNNKTVDTGGLTKSNKKNIATSSTTYKETGKGDWIYNKGYKPKEGERTLEGFMNNNVSIDKEIPLHTNSQGFNNTPKEQEGSLKDLVLTLMEV